MIVKIIWILIGINITALVIFIGAYFVLSEGRNVDSMEKGWTLILAGLGLLVIALAAVPLRFSQSHVSLVVSGFFAALPLMIAVGVFLSKNLPSFKAKETFASTYYKDKMQQKIASAIETNDTTLLKQLTKGQDLNIQGIKVWDWPGLNYLQFAVRIRSNPISFPFNDEANVAAIRILLANGSNATPALAEATKYLPPGIISELIDAGADPNTRGFVNPDPLLFEVIGSTKAENDMAILLIQKGADVNAKNGNGFTPVMHASYRAGTTPVWNDTWRLVRYMLDDAHAEYTYVSPDGHSLSTIISNIRTDAEAKGITMPPDFIAVVAWLKRKE